MFNFLTRDYVVDFYDNATGEICQINVLSYFGIGRPNLKKVADQIENKFTKELPKGITITNITKI